MNKTSIDYLTHTWNPIVMRCTPISEACNNCWHITMANRLSKNPRMSNDEQAAYAGEIDPLLIENRLEEPLRRKKPAVIGVQFMGDLFHDNIPNDFIFDILTTVASCPQHIFLILTKRPRRMAHMWRRATKYAYPNLWLGVTVEKPEYSYRADYLRKTPATVRYISFEPLLASFNDCPGVLDGIDWAIVGGETGPGARPMHPDWARGVLDQCQEADVPFFFKSWGAWIDYHNAPPETRLEIDRGKYTDGYVDDAHIYRVSKARAGHLLDGREWREMPNVDYPIDRHLRNLLNGVFMSGT